MKVIVYQTKRGKEPFNEWLSDLRDGVGQRLILRRIGRLREGIWGDSKILKGYRELRELRIPHGPGYRVYYAKLRGEVVLLLGGGTKRSQPRDIEKAARYLVEYKEQG